MSAAADVCPICGKPRQVKFAPFCSRRCAQIDLGRWLKGSYAIPSTEPDKGPKPEPDDEESPEN